MMACRRNHFFDFLIIANIAWIDTQAVCTHICHRNGDFVIKMNIGNKWNGYAFFYLSKGSDALHRWCRYTHQVCTCVHASLNLCNCCINITGVCICHTLHADGCIAADGDIANIDFFGRAAFNRIVY